MALVIREDGSLESPRPRSRPFLMLAPPRSSSQTPQLDFADPPMVWDETQIPCRPGEDLAAKPVRQGHGLERFRAKWIPVRVKKTRQNKRLEPRSDSIRTE